MGESTEEPPSLDSGDSSETDEEEESTHFLFMESARHKTQELQTGASALFAKMKKRVNPKFRRNFALSIREAFFVVLLARPLISLDFLQEGPLKDFFQWTINKEIYTEALITFFIFNVDVTLGGTVAALTSGLKGTILATLNSWFMVLCCPGGSQGEQGGRYWWFGAIEGTLFCMMLLLLKFDNGAVIWSIGNFVYYWMDFMTPGANKTHPPWDPAWPWKDPGTMDFLGFAVPSLLMVLVLLIPYPIRALDNAFDIAEELKDHLPALLRAVTDLLDSETPCPDDTVIISKTFQQLSAASAALPAELEMVGWEKYFSFRYVDLSARRLQAYDHALSRAYDHLFSVFCVCRRIAHLSERSQSWSTEHLRIMQPIKPALQNCVDEVEPLLESCVKCCRVGSTVGSEEHQELKRNCDKAQRALDELWAVFVQERSKMCAGKSPAEARKVCFQDLYEAHILVYNTCHVLRRIVHFGTALDEDHHFKEIDGEHTMWSSFTSLFDNIQNRDNLGYAFRSTFAVASAFFIGLFGLSSVTAAGSPAIPWNVSLLLGRFSGSLMAMGMARVNGVLLGSNLGNVSDNLFPGCDLPRLYARLLCIFLFFLIAQYLRVSADSDRSSAAAMMFMAMYATKTVYGCDSGDGTVEESFDLFGGPMENLLAVLVVVGADALFSRTRPSQMASQRTKDCLKDIQSAVRTALGTQTPQEGDEDDSVRATIIVDILEDMQNEDARPRRQNAKHKDMLIDAVKEMKSLADEALQEPRGYRHAWPAEAFTGVANDLSEAAAAVAAMESSLYSKGTPHAEKKVRHLLEKYGKDIEELLKKEFETTFSQLRFFDEEEEFDELVEASVMRKLRKEEEVVWKKFATLIEGAAELKISDPDFEKKHSFEDPMACLCSVAAPLRRLIHCLHHSKRVILGA